MGNRQWGYVQTKTEAGEYVTLQIEMGQGLFLLASLKPKIGGTVNGNPGAVYSAFNGANEIYIRSDVYLSSEVGKPAALYWLAGGKG